MFKKLREKIYNKKIETELKNIKCFDNLYNEIYSIYPTFVEYGEDGKQQTIEPKTIYALKRAIQKLSFHYVRLTSVEDFENDLNKIFAYANFDRERKKECLDLFKSRKQINSKTKRFFEREELNLVKKFLNFYGFNWNGEYSSVHNPNPKKAEKITDLMPEEECAFLYEDAGKGGFFMINKLTFCKFVYKGNEKFEIESNLDEEWKQFQLDNKTNDLSKEN